MQPQLQQLLQLAEQARNSGDLTSAVQILEQAVGLAPESAEAQFRLGRALELQGRPADAEALFAEALRLEPERVEAALHLGQTLYSQGKLDEAEARFMDVVRSHPELPWAHCGLGIVYYGARRFEQAIECYRQAIALDPNFAEAHFNLGAALRALDRSPEAIRSFETALLLRPALPAAHLSLAAMYLEIMRPDEAAAASRRAIELAPQAATGHAHLASALQLQGDMDGAIAQLRKAIALNPADAALHSNLVYTLNFHPDYSAQQIFDEHLEWARRHAEPWAPLAATHLNDRTGDRRLRVGYVSSHLREHAVSFFIEPILAAHDPAQFEVICYSDVRRPDAVTRRIQSCVAAWREIVGQSDSQVAEQIREDRIDLLVDLAGHIGGNRLLVFGRKPAPVQISYLGYQNTTGMSAMHYRLSDEHADPPGLTERFHTERLERLRPTFYCFAPSDPAPEVNPLPALSRGSVTFASLNHINKLTSEALQTWARILRAVPDSRLLLLAYSPGRLENDVRMTMSQASIDPARVSVVNKRPRYEYLQMHGEIDIALDTFPFQGHTTVCDALWMGVPSIMLEGDRYAARFGGTAMRQVGLADLIAGSVDDYVAIAAGLAMDLPRLAGLRRELRGRMRASPLVDAVAFTRTLEACYRRLWRTWCEQA